MTANRLAGALAGRHAIDRGSAEIVGSDRHANYDVSPDGRTFIMVRRSPANRIVILQNFPALDRRLRGASVGGC